MPKCTVTLNVARLGKAYDGRSVVVSDLEARDDGTYWTTAEHESVPLSNAPLATIDLDQGMPYAFVLPDGSTSIRMVPSAPSVNFSAMDVLDLVPGTTGLIVQQYTWVLLSTEPLPAQAVAGQTYFNTDTNVFGQIGA